MKTAQKKRLAEILLASLVKQGLSASGLPFPAPVLVNDIKETEALLERTGHEFLTLGRNQTPPRDTPKKIHLKIAEQLETCSKYTPEGRLWAAVWVCLDADVAMKALVLGAFPEATSPRRKPQLCTAVNRATIGANPKGKEP